MVCREGNKQGIANNIISLIPDHNFYIEPFCGMGGVFLNKPRAKYNSLNDIDDFVYDFWNCLLEDKERLIREVNKYPIYSRILKESGIDKYVNVAKRLLFISYSFLGTEREPIFNGIKSSRINLVQKIQEFITENTIIFNYDYEKFIKSLSFSDKRKSFIYCDPPYLVSKGGLKSNKGWKEQDLHNLINLLNTTGCKYMISEMNDPKVVAIFESYGLYIHWVGKNKFSDTQGVKKQEIVAINYNIHNNLF